jgi:hypothetical protein
MIARLVHDPKLHPVVAYWFNGQWRPEPHDPGDQLTPLYWMEIPKFPPDVGK